MTNSSDSGISVALDFVLSGHSISTQQTLAVRVELFVQNLKSVFYQVEESIIGQISEIVDGVSNSRYSRVILKVLRYSARKALKMLTPPARTAFYQACMKSQYNEGTTISSPPFEAAFVKKSAYSVSDKSLTAKRSLAYLNTIQSMGPLPW
ncbi:Hypothetical_protein [Hexamita inflata]|uniref:Hypothetical_protein n=1 Tax=Hexamita inflata TaxID=28002 RepID=A0AA86UNS9_9EUKA|nr:Hypothetical protein HINF_LOCUS33603 [Hexamita inflata]